MQKTFALVQNHSSDVVNILVSGLLRNEVDNVAVI